jgi:hypothetical protein
VNREERLAKLTATDGAMKAFATEKQVPSGDCRKSPFHSKSPLHSKWPSLQRMLRPFPFPCILLNASLVVAIGRSFHEFATADFFNDASAKPLAD